MRRALPITLALLGWALAQGVFVFGLWFALRGDPLVPGRFPGAALMAGGTLLGLWLVIDPLVPDAGPAFSGGVKGFALGLFAVFCGLSLHAMADG
ncbi:MAG: hypothetical protein ACPGYV_08870 [Phycisphaeraceae bacterium]